MADGRAGAPTPPPRTRDRELRARGQRTLERLLEAGADVFATRGYHAARVDDIVKAAATSHGTFYLYFSSKEDLFRALAVDVAESMVTLARELPELTAEPSPDGDGTTGGRAALRDWLARFRALYARYGALLRCWTEAEITDSEMGKVGGDLVIEFSQQLTARLRAAAPELHAGVAALAFVAMIERANYYLESRQVRVDPDEMVTTLAAVIHAGVFGARGHPAAAPSPDVS